MEGVFVANGRPAWTGAGRSSTKWHESAMEGVFVAMLGARTVAPYRRAGGTSPR